MSGQKKRLLGFARWAKPTGQSPLGKARWAKPARRIDDCADDHLAGAGEEKFCMYFAEKGRRRDGMEIR